MMNPQTHALLEHISELSQQIRDKNSLQSDTLAGVFKEFRRALQRFEEAEADLRRQNQALAAARAELEAERRRYHEMFAYAPDAYLLTGADGAIREANLAAAELLQVSPAQLAGRALIDFVEPADRRLFDTMLQNVVRISDIEIRMRPAHGAAVDISLTLAAVFDEAGRPAALRWILRDVTERKRAQAALDASERRFRAIYHAAEVGILLCDLDGRILDSNPALQAMLGYTPGELRGRAEYSLCFSQDESQWQERLAEMRAGDAPHARFEKRYRARDGREVWAHVTLSLLRGEGGAADAVIGLVRNITAEREAGAELAEMRRRMLESAEIERLRLAQELHDGPLQDLYGAIFQFSQYSDPEQQEEMGRSLELLRAVAGTLRTICVDLRPPTLNNLGLERAIRSHCDKLEDQYPDLQIELHLSRDQQALPEQTRLALYRVYQECMANVLRHAQANRVVVALHVDEDEISLDVWDNGCGFDVPGKWVELLRQGHYGLAGAAERIDALGGRLQIESSGAAGTLVHAVVPRG